MFCASVLHYFPCTYMHKFSSEEWTIKENEVKLHKMHTNIFMLFELRHSLQGKSEHKMCIVCVWAQFRVFYVLLVYCAIWNLFDCLFVCLFLLVTIQKLHVFCFLVYLYSFVCKLSAQHSGLFGQYTLHSGSLFTFSIHCLKILFGRSLRHFMHYIMIFYHLQGFIFEILRFDFDIKVNCLV